MSARTPADDGGTTTTQRALRLKERVYITFATLAVVLAVRSHVEGTAATDALVTLVVTVGGTLLAVLAADLVSHVVTHQAVPTAPEVRRMVEVVAGASTATVLPVLFVVLAAFEVWTLDVALLWASVVLVLGLALVGYLAARSLSLSRFQTLVVLLVESLIGAVVVGLQILAKGG